MKSAFPAMSVVLLGLATASHAATFKVHKAADDGTGNTLRWAIEQSNAHPGSNTIEIRPVGQRSPLVIQLNTLLPAIEGPVRIIGVTQTGERPDDPQDVEVILDGSKLFDVSTIDSCPGTVAGVGPNTRSIFGPALAVVDSGNVEISGLEIRNFCMGILALRSHDNHFHHNYIHNTIGAAGIEITGDDGTPAGGATTGLSVRNTVDDNLLVDTGDAIGFDRGSADSIAANNVAHETGNGVAPRSQGIELAGAGNMRIDILDNVFIGFSDGLQLNTGTDLRVSGNLLESSTYGITARGTGVVIADNVIRGNRMGVGPASGSGVTISRNAIYGNGQPILSLPNSAGGTIDPSSPATLGIDVGVNGVTLNDQCSDGFPDCDGAQNFPLLTTDSTWNADGTLSLHGTLASRPNQTYTLEVFANHAANPSGYGEGEAFVGNVTIDTGATGTVTFVFVTAASNPLRDGSTHAWFTATATRAGGSTSEFSPALALTKGGG